MKRLGANTRDLLVGIGLAAGLGLFTCWIVRGLGICPPKANVFAASCRAEASQVGLLFRTVVGGFIALVTIVVVLFNRGRGD